MPTALDLIIVFGSRDKFRVTKRVIAARSTAAIAIRRETKIRGDANGIPYLTPINPVLHKSTKPAGASFVTKFFMEVASRIR